MKILEVKSLAIAEIKVLRFSRFCDPRGYFTETYRASDLASLGLAGKTSNFKFVQANESYSRRGVVRGLHFQWNPFMGKLVRTISGHMFDLVLDIRLGAKTFGQAIIYEMPASPEANFSEWIWVPPGFAHGNFFLDDSTIEYLCTGEYNSACESGISPMAQDIDWSLCGENSRTLLFSIFKEAIITDKDRSAQSLTTWKQDPRAQEFKLEKCNVAQ